MSAKTDYGLIIQPGALGDCLLTTPLVRLMRRQLGLERVDIMGHRDYLEVLVGRSEVGRVISLDRTPLHRLFTDSDTFDFTEGEDFVSLLSPYTYIVTFLGDEAGHFERNLAYAAAATHAAEVIRMQLRPVSGYSGHIAEFFTSQLRQALAVMELTPPPDLLDGPWVNMTAADEACGRRLLAEALTALPNRVVAVHPGSGGAAKCWPLENYLALIGKLRASGFRPVVLLGPAESERWDEAGRRALAGEAAVLADLSVPQVAAVLSCAAAYVGNDSGVSHLAGAIGAPGVAIFGPTDERLWRPLGPTMHVCRGAEGAWPSVEQVLDMLTGTALADG